MAFIRNEFGVPQYPASDARRLFVLAAAIDLLERASQAAISDLTSLPREDIDPDVNRLREEFGMVLHKVGDTYRIESWGAVLQRDGVKKYLKG